MEIDIQGRNLKVTPALEDHTRKKLNKLDRYLPNIANVHVEFERQNTKRGDPLSVAQITVRHQRGAILRAQESTPGEMENALNMAISKLYHQIERFKGKQSRKGRERFSASAEELSIAETAPGDLAEAAFETPELEIIRRKEIAVIAMTEQEAIEQMELLGHNFFLYHDQVSGKMAVVYKRSAGDYGVLIPLLT